MDHQSWAAIWRNMEGVAMFGSSFVAALVAALQEVFLKDIVGWVSGILNTLFQ
jgi:hypothetical protein